MPCNENGNGTRDVCGALADKGYPVIEVEYRGFVGQYRRHPQHFS